MPRKNDCGSFLIIWTVCHFTYKWDANTRKPFAKDDILQQCSEPNLCPQVICSVPLGTEVKLNKTVQCTPRPFEGC